MRVALGFNYLYCWPRNSLIRGFGGLLRERGHLGVFLTSNKS